MTILDELQAAAAKKWRGDPDAQQAGLFARAASELERLTACLKKANAQAEHFEREWYLRGDKLERLQAELEREHEDHKQTLADVDTLVAAERERCAKACEHEADLWRGEQDVTDFLLCAGLCRSGHNVELTGSDDDH